MNILLDICLREIQTEKEPSIRIQILRMVETIMDHAVYRKYPYKLEDIRDMVTELILYEPGEDEQGSYSVKEREYIAKLNLKFQMMSM